MQTKFNLMLVKLKLFFLNHNTHLKVNGKRLNPTDSLKYLGIAIDKKITWYYQIKNVTEIKQS